MRLTQFYEKNRLRLALVEANALIAIEFDGDEVVVEIEGIGRLSNICRIT